MAGACRIGSVGELLVEFVCTEKDGRHRRPGLYAGPYPSGAPGIFIDQAARVGGRAIFVGALGDDAFGDVISERLRSDGVDISLIATIAGVPTGSAFVSYNDDGSRDFVFNIVHSAAARFDAGAATLDKLKSFGLEVMHVSGSALSNADMCARILGLCQRLHAAGVRISFDPNVRKELMGNTAYAGAVDQLMRISRYFLPSEEDAAALFPRRELADFADTLFAQGTECVVLKRGAAGAIGMHRDGATCQLPAHKVGIVDPTGAGDCFCATFVTLFASGGHTFEEALTIANAAGALAVSKLGPMEGNSTLASIRTFLDART